MLLSVLCYLYCFFYLCCLASHLGSGRRLFRFTACTVYGWNDNKSLLDLNCDEWRITSCKKDTTSIIKLIHTTCALNSKSSEVIQLLYVRNWMKFQSHYSSLQQDVNCCPDHWVNELENSIIFTPELIIQARGWIQENLLKRCWEMARNL